MASHQAGSTVRRMPQRWDDAGEGADEVLNQLDPKSSSLTIRFDLASARPGYEGMGMSCSRCKGRKTSRKCGGNGR